VSFPAVPVDSQPAPTAGREGAGMRRTLLLLVLAVLALLTPALPVHAASAGPSSVDVHDYRATSRSG
jgi:hypothetical protein